MLGGAKRQVFHCFGTSDVCPSYVGSGRNTSAAGLGEASVPHNFTPINHFLDHFEQGVVCHVHLFARFCTAKRTDPIPYFSADVFHMKHRAHILCTPGEKPIGDVI